MNSLVLDLRYKGQLDYELCEVFNELAISLRSKFNTLIKEISLPNKHNIDWWVLELPSRNTYANSFFHIFCCIHLLNKIIKDSNFVFKNILVDSATVKNIIEEILCQNSIHDCSVIIDNDLKKRFKRHIKKKIGGSIILFYNILKLFIAKYLTISNSSRLSSKPLTLIDTFIISRYSNPNRFYGSLWKNLSQKIKATTFFVPSITRMSLLNLFFTYNKIKTDEYNYLIKEEYLCLKDLIFAYNHPKRIKNYKINKIRILDYDITEIIKEDINYPTDIFSIQESLLTYRFIKRLEQKKVRIRLAIDWFEGQIIDKAWNFGFHQFYPLVKTIAYRAYESYPLYLCSFPIPIEHEAGVIPKVFALQGPKTISSVKEFIPQLNTLLIPAYKAEYVWKRTNLIGSDKSKNIIVTLPIAIDISDYIISIIFDVCDNEICLENNFKFIIKPHPTRTLKDVYPNYLKTIPKNVVFNCNETFSRLLYSANTLITEASSTCLESISIGVPVILIKRKGSLFHNPLPEGIDDELFKICSSADELIEALKIYIFMNNIEREKLINKGHLVRENYFQPITKEGTNRFMDLSQIESHLHA